MADAPSRRLLAAALPIVAAVGVFGVSFGVLAAAAHIPAWQSILMSATVFAGSAQFAAVAVLGSGGAPLAAFTTGALLNARYLPIGIVAGRVLPGGRLRRFLASQLIVDESFVIGVAMGSPTRPEPRAMLISGVALWSVWVGGTAIGAALGDVVGDPQRLGLDAAFPALFLALLWPMLRDRRMTTTLAVICGLAAITIAWKGTGALFGHIPDVVTERLGGLAPALLAALVLTQLVDRRGVPQLDARAAGVAVAALLAWRRAHLAVIIVAGAATAAALRAAGAA